MNAKLLDLIKSHDRLDLDRQKMLADLKQCEETEALILSDGKVTDSEISELTRARGLKELILRRLPDLEVMLRKLETEIRAELSKCAQKFNRAVRDAREAVEKQIIAGNAQWWPGNLRGLKKWVESAEIPAIREIRRAHFEAGFCAAPEIDFYASQARAFLEISARFTKAFSLVVD